MLHFEGEQDFALVPADVWSRLSDARFLVECVPGIEKVLKAEPGSAAWTLRPGLSFMRGTLHVTLRILEAVPATSLRLGLHSKGIGSTSTVEAALVFQAVGDGTHIDWSADINELGGLLKAVPRGLIQASAQKVIADVWAQIVAHLQ